MDRSPTRVTYDPDRGGAPAELEAIGGELAGGTHGVLLAASADAREDQWGARAAIGIARAFGGRGRRAVLADLDFENPTLHTLLGVANGEGLADVLLYGASPEHVAVHIDGSDLDFIPAGAWVPDPRGVLEHEGWGRVLAQLDAAGRLLLAYAPADAGGLDALARTLGRLILLGPAAEGARGVDIAAGRVLAVVEPASALQLPPGLPALTAPVPEAEPLAMADAEPDVVTDAGSLPSSRVAAPAEVGDAARESFERIRLPRDSEREALIADLRARQRAALSYPTAAPQDVVVHPRPIVGGPGEAQGPVITEPPIGAIRLERKPPRRRSRLVLTLVALILLSALAGLWHFGRGYLAARRAPTDAQDSVSAPRPAVGLTGEPAGEPLPYSVAIEAHQDLPTAVRRVESLARAEPASGFYIAPILVDSALYYRIMAGPVRDSAAAAAVMAALISKGHKTGGSEWDIRATPYAFLLGEYELREQADQRMAQLSQLDIPSYVIEVPYTNGPPRYFLYSGAYSGAAEADVMRQLLRSAGLADTLVERTGRSPT